MFLLMMMVGMYQADYEYKGYDKLMEHVKDKDRTHGAMRRTGPPELESRLMYISREREVRSHVPELLTNNVQPALNGIDNPTRRDENCPPSPFPYRLVVASLARHRLSLESRLSHKPFALSVRQPSFFCFCLSRKIRHHGVCSFPVDSPLG